MAVQKYRILVQPPTFFIVDRVLKSIGKHLSSNDQFQQANGEEIKKNASLRNTASHTSDLI